MNMNRKQRLKYWSDILERQEESGKSLLKYCKDTNLNYKVALNHRHMIEAMLESAAKGNVAQAVNFLEVPSLGDSNEDAPEGIRLELENGIKLELPSGFDQGRFVRIVQLLCEDAPC
jgi:hypothetical protein